MAEIDSEPGPSKRGSVSLDLTLPARKRKVPDELRQRVETSCDRCKTRKRRCIRAFETDVCTYCKESNAECRTTLPRKRKPTTSQANARYALLDSIVRKIYPDNDIDSLTGLSSLAKRLGAEDGRAGSDYGEGTPGEIGSEAREGGPAFEPSEVPDGWLVPAPRGGHHYVGSSSLVFFARCAREIIGKSNLFNQPAFDENGLRRYLKATEFTTYKVSHTIEANLQGHPATLAASPSATAGGSNGEVGFSPRDGVLRTRQLDRALASRLIDTYFERVNNNFPVVHRGAFQMQYDRLPSGDIKEPGWTCTLHMVYTLGAQGLEGDLAGSKDLQEEFLSYVIREGLGRLVLTSTLSNVQALLLLSLYQHNAGERNTAWILVGQAIRAGVALGLHRDGENNHFDPFERNIRRTVWWSLHILEQHLSLALGRPSFTHAFNINAGMPEPSFETSVGLPPGHIERQVSLSRLWAPVKQAVAVVSVQYEDPTRLLEWYPAIMAIHSQIESWRRANQAALGVSQVFLTRQDRQSILLLIWADYLESVLCRPFLLCRVNQDVRHSGRPPQIDQIAGLCVAAAQASVQKLLVLADQGLLEGSVWLDFYAVQHAIMVSSLHTLGQPDDATSSALREPTSRLISHVQSTRLAPTYRITMNVALQLAFISGIAANDVRVSTRQPSPARDHLPAGMVPPIHPPAVSTTSDLHQLFGMLPPAQEDAPPDIFADFFNMGYAPDDAVPWDFFALGDNVQGSMLGGE